MFPHLFAPSRLRFALGTDGSASFANGDFGRKLRVTCAKVIFSATAKMQKNPLARAIQRFGRRIPRERDWLADGAVCCEPVSVVNSLIYRENTGKYIDFGHNLGSARPETAAAAEAFFRNSLQFVAGNYF
jgi:hypothetical protein